MSNDLQNGNDAGNGNGFEHEDLKPSGILYFLLALAVATILSLVGLKGFYAYLDHRGRALQPEVNPLVTNIPADTRHIAPGYPQSAFPNPRLEKDEGEWLDGILTDEQKRLYSYGWVDEKAGTVHIPIERAMDLVAQRGLSVRPQGAANEVASTKPATGKKDKKQ